MPVPMMLLLSVLPLGAILAAGLDLTTYNIPNWLTGAVALAFPVVAAVAGVPWPEIGLGLGAGALLAVSGLLLAQPSCELAQNVDELPRCGRTPSVPLLGSGAVLGLVGVASGLLLMPRDTDVQEMVDAWNARHPSEPLEDAPLLGAVVPVIPAP